MSLSNKKTSRRSFAPGTSGILNSKERFSNRVDDYRKYRPHYPAELIGTLKEVCGLSGRSVVADIGSGTGFMTELLLPHCKRVYAVEPNNEMREAAVESLQSDRRFVSVDGSAEASGLGSGHVDIIVSAQAFHWFNRRLAGTEFRRILKQGGWVVLVWNMRETKCDNFHRELEQFLMTAVPDYLKVHRRHVRPKVLSTSFFHNSVITRYFSGGQELDWQGFRGRMLSASYVPKPRQPGYRETMKGFEEIFRLFQVNGKVVIKHVTEVYLGRFS
ncbi:MAG TPA: class I SAM-dependent methyltransferase [Bacteroidota bacterium]|nr:class I SAM-dependent methyltransferase [Bacteroidota bacterium]